MTKDEKTAVWRMTRTRGWEVVRSWLDRKASEEANEALSELARMDVQTASLHAIRREVYLHVLQHVEGLAREGKPDGEEG